MIKTIFPGTLALQITKESAMTIYFIHLHADIDFKTRV